MLTIAHCYMTPGVESQQDPLVDEHRDHLLEHPMAESRKLFSELAELCFDEAGAGYRAHMYTVNEHACRRETCMFPNAD